MTDRTTESGNTKALDTVSTNEPRRLAYSEIPSDAGYAHQPRPISQSHETAVFDQSHGDDTQGSLYRAGRDTPGDFYYAGWDTPIEKTPPVAPASASLSEIGATPPRVATEPKRPSNGVRIGPFVGAVVVTSAITALVVALFAWVLELILMAVPATYWESVEVARTPSMPVGPYIWLAIGAHLACAALLFGLIKLGIAPVGRWFRLITMLLTAIAVVAVISVGGPWQHVVPIAALIAVCGLSMSIWCTAFGRATTLQPHDF